jgi:integrase
MRQGRTDKGQTMRVSESMDAYLAARVAAGRAANTMDANRRELRRLAEAVGDCDAADLCIEDIDGWAQERLVGAAPASASQRVATVRMWLRWSAARGHHGLHADQVLDGLGGRRAPRQARRRVPVERFADLLDAAGRHHPRDRAAVAVGLYLMLRRNEARDILVGDVDLLSSEVAVTIPKTRDFDLMPVCAELDFELRLWLDEYAARCGPLQPHWRLLPSLGPNTFACPISERRPLPEQAMSNLPAVVSRALEGIGWADTRGDGCHTLRRSGARAMFDSLAAQGYDGALRQVMAMLHHTQASTTEAYLGLDVDRARRDARVKGLPMHPSLTPPAF